MNTIGRDRSCAYTYLTYARAHTNCRQKQNDRAGKHGTASANTSTLCARAHTRNSEIQKIKMLWAIKKNSVSLFSNLYKCVCNVFKINKWASITYIFIFDISRGAKRMNARAHLLNSYFIRKRCVHIIKISQ